MLTENPRLQKKVKMNCELLTIQPVCNPCAKTCQRIAWPYVGWLGIIATVIEFIIIVIFALMLVGIIFVDDRVILAILLIVTTIIVILWIINLFWRAPCFTMARTPPTCEYKCGLELIAKLCPGDYAIRVREDLYHTRDETHLRNSVVTGLWFLFMFAIFVGPNGGQVFDNIDSRTSAAGFMHFVIGRIIIMAMIGAYGLGIRALLDAEPDFWWRHLTAVDNDQLLGQQEVPFVGVGTQSPVSKPFSRKHVDSGRTDVNAF